MRQGETYRSDLQQQQQPSGSRPTLHSGKSHIYEKAFALSRSTSIRRTTPTHEMDPEQDDGVDEGEGADYDDRHASINLLGNFGTSRKSASTSASPVVDDGPGPERFANTSHQQRRASGDLLGNAFRSSMASDASFNTITGQNDRDSIMFQGTNAPIDRGLFRRDSMDTVRSSEFDEGGRWGRAWSGKAEDEESLYGGSEWGSNDADMGSSSRWDMGEDPGALRSRGGGGGLDSLRNLAQGRGLEGLTLSDAPGQQSSGYSVHHTDVNDGSSLSPSMATGNAADHWRPQAGRERIVSLTPSVHGLSEDYTSGARARDSTSTLRNGDAHRRMSTDSVSTIDADAGGRLARHDGQDEAHVVVWPPTPAGSDISHGPSNHVSRVISPDAASIHEWEAVSDDGQDDEQDHRRQSGHAGVLAAASPPHEGPATISSILAHRPAPDSPSTARRGGHPAGRAPPPPPMASGRYEDPNAAVPRGGLGRARAAAIAAADGRESIVSDLDVETLRLDGGSSRRDSASTVRSRMSVGTVRYDDLDLDVSGNRPPSQRVISPISSPTQRSLSLGSGEGEATPQASATVMSRNVSQPTYSSSRPMMPSNGSANHLQRSAMANSSSTKSMVSSPPTAAMKPQPSQSSMRTSTTTTGRSSNTLTQDTKTGPTSAENYLTQGISYHEQGDLSRSAYYFERSAKVDGGCVVGMCMWGMTLREGWGARKDPRKGFEWIQRAAAKAGEMMQSTNSVRKSEAELKAIRSELKLSVYELGKCYCYGWGIKMDKRVALDYFELAAKLGDADAQAEAGALYAAGKGCKKDLKKAAKYYRMAAAQGYDLIGLSWVWKPKFDD